MEGPFYYQFAQFCALGRAKTDPNVLKMVFEKYILESVLSALIKITNGIVCEKCVKRSTCAKSTRKGWHVEDSRAIRALGKGSQPWGLSKSGFCHWLLSLLPVWLLLVPAGAPSSPTASNTCGSPIYHAGDFFCHICTAGDFFCPIEPSEYTICHRFGDHLELCWFILCTLRNHFQCPYHSRFPRQPVNPG